MEYLTFYPLASVSNYVLLTTLVLYLISDEEELLGRSQSKLHINKKLRMEFVFSEQILTLAVQKF